MTMTDHTEGELWLFVRQERAQLAKEWNEITTEERRIVKRKGEISRRLEQLDTAENILEGGLH